MRHLSNVECALLLWVAMCGICACAGAMLFAALWLP